MSVIFLLLSMLSVQFGATQAKDLFPLVGVAGAATLRLMFSSLILLIVFRPWKKKFTKAEWKSLFLFGASLGIMNFSFYFALQKIPLGIAVALEFTGPLAVAIFSSHRKLDYLWAVLAGVGICLLLPMNIGSESLDPWGIFFALFAGLCWALYIIFGQRAGNGLQGGHAISIGMMIAALVVMPMGFAMEGTRIFSLEAVPTAFFVGIFGSALPYTLEIFVLKKMPAKTFGVLMSLEPALASLMGLVFLSEQLTLIQWSAILCVIVSSFGSSLTSAQK